MELNLHSIATKSFVSDHEFQEHERVVSYLVRPAAGTVEPGKEAPAFVRHDLLESEDRPEFAKGNFATATDQIAPAAFVYCRWVVDFKPRKDGNSAQALKLTAENLFLTLAIPAGSLTSAEIESGQTAVNTPLLQFLALMMERKKLIKPVGKTDDGLRTVYEHRASHARYEVPIGNLDVEFFKNIQEHLGVLVGTPKKKEATPDAKTEAPAPAETTPAPDTAPTTS